MGQAVGGGGQVQIIYTRPGFTTARPSGPRPDGRTPFDYGNQTQIAQDRAEIKALVQAGDIAGARKKLSGLIDAAKSAKTEIRLGRQREGNAVAKDLVDRLDVSSPKEKIFWSGDKHLAGAHANQHNQSILEQTDGARVTDDWKEVNDALPWTQGGERLWGGLSAKYAMDADAKNIKIIQTQSKFPFGGDVWRNYEWPQVKGQGKVETIEIHRVDKDGNIQDTAYMDPKTEKVTDKDGNEFRRGYPNKNDTSRLDPHGNVVDTTTVVDWNTYETRKMDPSTGAVTEWKTIAKDPKTGVVTTTLKDPVTGDPTAVTRYDPSTGLTETVPIVTKKTTS